MGENTRIPPKFTIYHTPEPIKKTEDVKTGKLGSEHEVTLLSIIKDIPAQGISKTIQSLFEFIFLRSGSKVETPEGHDDYVITVSQQDTPLEPTIHAVSTPILLPSGEKSAKLSLQERVKQGIVTYNDVINELKNQNIVNKDQHNQLFIRPAPTFNRNAPLNIDEIKKRILADRNTTLTDQGILIDADVKRKIEEFIDNLKQP